MFGSVSKDLILKALQRCNYDENATVDFVLKEGPENLEKTLSTPAFDEDDGDDGDYSDSEDEGTAYAVPNIPMGPEVFVVVDRGNDKDDDPMMKFDWYRDAMDEWKRYQEAKEKQEKSDYLMAMALARQDTQVRI